MTPFSELTRGSEARDHVLKVKDVSKSYLVWKDPAARLKVPLLRLLSNNVPRLRSPIDVRMANLCQEFIALRNISFDLARGTSMAVIGRNGSGKSTLLQLIAGTLQPTHGEVERHGRIAALLELGSGFNPEFTGRDNVYMNGAIYGLDSDDIARRMHEVEDFAEIGSHIDQPVKTYSSGMMMRLAFSVQVLLDPEVLIVDEALSVGDIFFQQKCFERMRHLTETGTSILFVSHDLVTVSQFTQTAMVLQGGECAFLGDSGVAVKEFQIMERASSYRPSMRPKEPARPSVGTTESASPVRPVNDPSEVATSSLFIESSPLAEIDLGGIIQIGKENAEFTRLRLFDSTGYPTSVFSQGGRMYVDCEILVHSRFECLSVGVSIKDRTNTFVHGKHSIQHGVRPAPLSAGDVIGFQFSFDLELALGQYSLDIGIIEIDQSVDAGIPVELMEASITRVCLNDGFASFQIGPRTDYRYFQLPFYGVADLDGECVRFS